jgi:catalase
MPWRSSKYLTTKFHEMKNLLDEKQRDLSNNKSDETNKLLTINKDVHINNDNNSLKVCEQKSSLIEDLILKNPTNTSTIASRKVAIICADGVSEAAVTNIKNAILNEDAEVLIVAQHLGSLLTDQNKAITTDFSFLNAESVLFDAVYIPHGLGFGTLLNNYNVMEFLNEAYKHCKVIGADGDATELIYTAPFASKMSKDDAGIILSKDIASETFAQNFIAAMGKHRFWEREPHLYN